MLEYFSKQNSQTLQFFVREYVEGENGKLHVTIKLFKFLKSEIETEIKSGFFDNLVFDMYVQDIPAFKEKQIVMSYNGKYTVL